jgi:hypothetical protein
MEKTIKDDLNREITFRKIINDNTLLEYYIKDNRFYITVRFVEGSSIKEHYLTVLPVDTTLEEFSQIVNFNEDNTAIAIFNKTDDGYQLHGVYDTEEHSYEASDFIDIAYDKKFKKKLNKRLIKEG